MRAIYLNENDVLPHVGCKAVGNAHRLLFDRLGIQVVHTFYKNDLWCYKQFSSHQQRVENISSRYRDLFRCVDALIINGEGTLHHGRGEDLLAMLDAATEFGVRTYLINALIQEMEGYSEVLSKCTAIVTRDPRSYAEAQRYSERAYLVPDSFVIADFEDVTVLPASDKLIVTDFLGTMPEGPGYIIDRLLKIQGQTSIYYPFQSPFTSAQWRSVVSRLRSARCIVSARHHGLYAAAMAGRPMVILESNSHKMAAFREMYGDFIPVINSFDQIEEGIAQACAAERDFQRLPELFRDKDVWGTYAAVFERPLKGFSRVKASQISAMPAGPELLPFSTSPAPKIKEKLGLGRILRRAQSMLRGQADFKAIPSRASTGRDEAGDGAWEAAYREDLLDAKRRRDPRLLPLRRAIQTIATEVDTYRRHRSFWDELIRLARSKRFLADEIAAIVPRVKDSGLLSRIMTMSSRARPDADYYGLSLSIVQMGMANSTARFRSIVEHLRNALRADSHGECAVLLEAVGELSQKQQSLLVNSVMPVLEEERAYKEILSLAMLFPDADINERNLLKVADSHFMLGRYEEAKSWLSKVKADKALALTADHRSGRIMIHLGEYEDGWPLMNRVVDREHFTEISDRLGLPVWSPNMAGVTRVVVWFHELGGIGGEILWGQLIRQFQAYVGCMLRLVVDPRLLVLFRESFPECEVVSRDVGFDEIKESADAFVFGRELTKLVVKQEGDFQAVASHKFRLQSAAPLSLDRSGVKHFAISWKTTNPASSMYRNVPLRELAKLLSGFDCHYHCLQHGDIREDLEALRSELGNRLHTETFDPSAAVEDIGGRLLQMDGVITIDNTTLHIAGALGVPTFALISIPAYWQWPAAGSWSRWYESVKLLRQDAPGHWRAVFDSLNRNMEEFMAVKTVLPE